MKEYFLDLLEYDRWANVRYIQTLEEEDYLNPKSKLLMSHLISSQIVWLHRIKDLPTSPFPLWQDYKLSEIKSMAEESYERWKQYIKDFPQSNFEEVIAYQNSKGENHENSLSNIITHVINHGTYHRSQIAILLRQDGIEPPVTDFIAYKRY